MGFVGRELRGRHRSALGPLPALPGGSWPRRGTAARGTTVEAIDSKELERLRARIKELEEEREQVRAGAFKASRSAARLYPATARKRQRDFTRWAERVPFDGEKLRESFQAVGEQLIDEVASEMIRSYGAHEMDVEHVRSMLEYNVLGGKLNRGLSVVQSGRLILEHASGRPASSEDLSRLAVLGWCVEWLQGWALIADDIMDAAETRRGKNAWYLRPGVGMNAINDALMLDSLIYSALKLHFAHEPFYNQLTDLFHETVLQTEYGQMLDTECANLELSDFTVERWTAIATYKTSLYSFYLPVALAMVYSGVRDHVEYETSREILITMGVYFQAQDDVLDCFAPPGRTGKIGTDIQDKKCSWLFANAYELANTHQRKTLQELYGKVTVQTPEEELVKEIYRDLSLESLFNSYEDRALERIQRLKPAVRQVPWTVYEDFLNMIYKRKS